MPRWLLLLLAGCGGQTAGGDAGSCQTDAGAIGNCFVHVHVAMAEACGLPAQATSKLRSDACLGLCPAGTNYCDWNGTGVLRCEQCQK